MSRELEGIRVACLATNGVEEVELDEPMKAFEAFGATVELLAPEAGRIQALRYFEKGRTFEVDRTIEAADPSEYDALFLPGGTMNADALRRSPDAVEFVRDFFDDQRPVAAICHGPWILVDANVLAGRTLTSWPSLRPDLQNAGGRWVDEEVHVSGNLVTSRKPADLPPFIAAAVDAFASLPAAGHAREIYRAAHGADRVEEASRESFPASDAPSSW
ncbi:type 1 glutamine amidotransferase domain-containing protein [Vulgatibacter incomptus]|uniref:ThiJ/PfpI family protein n=1 Tax=Vulgatibacter incomptus TaxID=1391653 RepID=A0A0K1P9H8_9BACT|nr:type 1 glutamine amidotransferase domain-containing protein [Vulgatibacter incomptus]AKU90193.1 ThiJ/PfpI family protein [Vulgatibacter incomptus]